MPFHHAGLEDTLRKHHSGTLLKPRELPAEGCAYVVVRVSTASVKVDLGSELDSAAALFVRDAASSNAALHLLGIQELQGMEKVKKTPLLHPALSTFTRVSQFLLAEDGRSLKISSMARSPPFRTQWNLTGRHECVEKIVEGVRDGNDAIQLYWTQLSSEKFKTLVDCEGGLQMHPNDAGGLFYFLEPLLYGAEHVGGGDWGHTTRTETMRAWGSTIRRAVRQNRSGKEGEERRGIILGGRSSVQERSHTKSGRFEEKGGGWHPQSKRGAAARPGCVSSGTLAPWLIQAYWSYNKDPKRNIQAENSPDERRRMAEEMVGEKVDVLANPRSRLREGVPSGRKGPILLSYLMQHLALDGDDSDMIA
ncbi:hypothetical protein C8F04DRAFT_1201975 [Mycena alexandri]|uniref:Uncharacterized protein n=1 Tax=Mycena alexandri TaxID=1745969 RepID=A0AAD6WPV3_9AGAR|nr:hypothetical protein C8F04DRAFT_1201975 [Mycena alexandri]